MYTKPHQCSGGIDLHARTRYGGILNQDGEIRRHRHMPARPEPFLQAIAPSGEALVVAVACRFPWSWLADLGAPPGIAFVLGHALYLKAMPGGTANNATIDARKIAVLRRGGRRPQAYVSPAALRATRDRLRRRVPLTRQRAERLAPAQPTNRQDNLPARRPQLASQAPREGGAERCPEPAAQQSVAVALARMNA